jgi:hypothetical protein
MIKHKGPDPALLAKEYWPMREVPVPSLFDTTATIPPVLPVETTPREEKRSEKLAKDFVKWCFSFGAAYRNSPDIINLRTWMGKTNLKLKDAEENDVLIEARRLYLKRIDQMMKKADAPMLATSEIAEAE